MAIRVPVNLATEPFRRDRPIVVGTVALSILLIVALAVQISMIFSERGQAAETRILLDRVTRQLNKVTAQQQKLDLTLNQPANSEVLEKSLFLNLLIQHKAISWNKLFADLEKVMPPDVRLVTVRLPQVDRHSHVWLDMTVAAKDPVAILDLVKRFEKSPQFSDYELLNTLPPSQTEPYIRTRMSVSYAQKL
jgi:type IV pilus assembly protein PilN